MKLQSFKYMASNYKLQEVAQLTGKGIFFDANVLIYLFWPTGQHFYEQNYAQVFGKLLKQKNSLFVDILVISEVINRVLRIEYNKLNMVKDKIDFKTFRNSQEGKEVISDSYLIVKDNILSNFNVIEKSFSKRDIEDMLIVDQLDFVDKAIVTVCSENNLVLLTNDRDFKNSGLDILTGNPHILA